MVTSTQNKEVEKRMKNLNMKKVARTGGEVLFGKRNRIHDFRDKDCQFEICSYLPPIEGCKTIDGVLYIDGNSNSGLYTGHYIILYAHSGSYMYALLEKDLLEMKQHNGHSKHEYYVVLLEIGAVSV
jgi:hypothetical protein